MLLTPQLGQKRREDAVEHLEAVNQGMMGGAEGDEQFFPGDAGAAVMNMDTLAAFPFPANAAGAAVAFEDSAPPSAETEPVVPVGGVTGGAESPYKPRRGSAGPAP